MKLIITILFAMVVTLFYYQNDLYVKLKQEEMLAQLRWDAQMDAFKLYSTVINKQSDIIVDLAKHGYDWRTS